MTTRVGDVFMLLGIAYLHSQTGTLSFRAILFNEETLHRLATTDSYITGLSVAGLAGILLFIGTIGKSAQFPLHVWLPDAMEGPTPCFCNDPCRHHGFRPAFIWSFACSRCFLLVWSTVTPPRR